MSSCTVRETAQDARQIRFTESNNGPSTFAPAKEEKPPFTQRTIMYRDREKITTLECKACIARFWEIMTNVNGVFYIGCRIFLG